MFNRSPGHQSSARALGPSEHVTVGNRREIAGNRNRDRATNYSLWCPGILLHSAGSSCVSFVRRAAGRGTRAKFPCRTSDSSLAGRPFSMLTVRLSAVKFAYSVCLRHVLHELIFEPVPKPKGKGLDPFEVHSRLPSSQLRNELCAVTRGKASHDSPPIEEPT